MSKLVWDWRHANCTIWQLIWLSKQNGSERLHSTKVYYYLFSHLIFQQHINIHKGFVHETWHVGVSLYLSFLWHVVHMVVTWFQTRKITIQTFFVGLRWKKLLLFLSIMWSKKMVKSNEIFLSVIKILNEWEIIMRGLKPNSGSQRW